MSAFRSLLFPLCILPLVAVAQEPLDEGFDTDVLVIVARDACYRFDIYLATNYEQHKRGLMRVRELPMTSGMLFVYTTPAYRSMWMKNTLIPLDILFAREDGSITNIVRDTVPQSLASIVSTEPATFTLELNAGATGHFSIDESSRLIWEPAGQ